MNEPVLVSRPDLIPGMLYRTEPYEPFLRPGHERRDTFLWLGESEAYPYLGWDEECDAILESRAGNWGEARELILRTAGPKGTWNLDRTNRLEYEPLGRRVF